MVATGSDEVCVARSHRFSYGNAAGVSDQIKYYPLE